ncbi:unnamed protein product [Closterium sp. NIES-53]
MVHPHEHSPIICPSLRSPYLAPHCHISLFPCQVMRRLKPLQTSSPHFTSLSLFLPSLIRLLTATIAWPVPAVVQVGIVLSTLGAALQNLMGAPRLLAAIANDNVLPVLNAFKAESHQEPHLATLFTLLLCCRCCFCAAVAGVARILVLRLLVAGSAAGAECVQGREPSGAASGHPLHTAPLLQVLLVVFLVVWVVHC